LDTDSACPYCSVYDNSAAYLPWDVKDGLSFSLGLATVDLATKFIASISTRYEDMRGDKIVK